MAALENIVTRLWIIVVCYSYSAYDENDTLELLPWNYHLTPLWRKRWPICKILSHFSKSSSLVPKRSLLPLVLAKSGKERARERLANIGKIPLILEQFYPWSHFTSFYSSILEKLLADSMDVSVEVSANSGKF